VNLLTRRPQSANDPKNTSADTSGDGRGSPTARNGSRVPAPKPAPELPDDTIKQLVPIFKLLSDETRLRILMYLTREEEIHVRALCELLGQSQPAVSHHLALLRVAKLIEPRRQGKHNFYRIQPQQFAWVVEAISSAVETK
jgi:ArsR family transcriptional regulator